MLAGRIRRRLLDLLDEILRIVTTDRGRVRNALVLVIGPPLCLAVALALVATAVFYLGASPSRWVAALLIVALVVAGLRFLRQSGRR